MSKVVLRQLGVLLAIVVTIAVNWLANALPLNGLNTGEISDRFAVYFVPAGYVFAIWGLIYAGLVAYGIYQALPSQRANARLRGVDHLFIFSCLANVVWLFLWHYLLIPLTVAAMVALLLLLIAIYVRLGIGRTQVARAERWLVHLPFSIYLGWITVATIANVTDVLFYFHWDGAGLTPVAWAVIMLAVAAALTTSVYLTRRDVAYVLVVVWAFVGIAVKQADAPPVVVAALVLAALLVVEILLLALRRPGRRSQLPAR